MEISLPKPVTRFAAWMCGGIILGVMIWLVAFTANEDILARASALSQTQFSQPPSFVGFLHLNAKEKDVRPFALALHNGNLLISFLGSDEILEYTQDLKRNRSLFALKGEMASLTSLLVEGDRLYATNFRSGELLILEYPSGNLLNTIGFFPDGKTRMKLFGVAFAMGTVYASDSRTNQILAISSTSVPGVKEEGELLLSFPTRSSENFQLSFPTFMAVTPDGRLLVSDVGHGEIKAFTCNGRPAHRFDTSAAALFSVPMGFAFDNLASPELLAAGDSVFNPSGVFRQGRTHVVDTKQSRIKVFNSLGKHVLSYGTELQQPNGIAIDRDRRLIFVADAELRSIALYRY